jgi:acetyl esterase/lipase
MKTLLYLAVLLVTSSLASAQLPRPPAQPLTGPAGKNYLHDGMKASGPYWAARHAGDDAYKYFIFEPASPAPASAPVVLFLHAWLAYEPSEYIWWIQHLVRKGHTVVWAQYDKTVFVTFNWASNAVDTWKDALARLDNPALQHVRPERDAQGRIRNAIIGHSAGAYLSAIVAVRSSRVWNGIPAPDVIASFLPGGKTLIPGDDFTRIPSITKVLLVTADADTIACNGTAAAVWNGIGHIAPANKDFLYVRSDSTGTPAQIADHYFPNNSGAGTNATVDARDFNVTYRLSVAALNCAFRGADCNIAFGNGSPEQLFMGNWSNGAPVMPLQFVTNPNTLPPIAGCEGK